MHNFNILNKVFLVAPELLSYVNNVGAVFTVNVNIAIAGSQYTLIINDIPYTVIATGTDTPNSIAAMLNTAISTSSLVHTTVTDNVIVITVTDKSAYLIVRTLSSVLTVEQSTIQTHTSQLIDFVIETVYTQIYSGRCGNETDTARVYAIAHYLTILKPQIITSGTKAKGSLIEETVGTVTLRYSPLSSTLNVFDSTNYGKLCKDILSRYNMRFI